MQNLRTRGAPSQSQVQNYHLLFTSSPTRLSSIYVKLLVNLQRCWSPECFCSHIFKNTLFLLSPINARSSSISPPRDFTQFKSSSQDSIQTRMKKNVSNGIVSMEKATKRDKIWSSKLQQAATWVVPSYIYLRRADGNKVLDLDVNFHPGCITLGWKEQPWHCLSPTSNASQALTLVIQGPCGTYQRAQYYSPRILYLRLKKNHK